MSKFNYLGAFGSALLLSAFLAGCALQGGLGKDSSAADAKISADVEAQLRQHRDLGPPNEIDVATHNRVVYLSGLVAHPLAGESAESIAHEVPGVAAVVNTIAVEQ